MDVEHSERLLGRGVYSVGESARLTGVSAARIRRWLRGYEFPTLTGRGKSEPVWLGGLKTISGVVALDFRDLLEIRYVDAFLKRGVSWRTLRAASQRATERFGDSRPFSTGRFKTDGRAVFAEIVDTHREPTVVDIVRQQHCFDSIVRPFLTSVDFDREEPLRWWPLGKREPVVIDPARSFGKPIEAERGVPTEILARGVLAGQSMEEVARWYEVSARAVRSAVEFESRSAA